MELNADLSDRVVIQTTSQEWVPSPMPGVERRMLERSGEDGSQRATSVVRYAPNSRFAAHNHPRGEEFLVLEGIFSDEQGDYPAGSYVRNPPGSRHSPSSTPGTTIFVKLQQFAPDDVTRVVIDSRSANWTPGPEPGVEVMQLHRHGRETVRLVRLSAGARMQEISGGAEIFVVSGRLCDEHGDYPEGTWLRNPPGFGHIPRSDHGAVVWIKTGHLG